MEYSSLTFVFALTWWHGRCLLCFGLAIVICIWKEHNNIVLRERNELKSKNYMCSN